MDRDGTKAGFDLELTRAVSDALEIPIIASGGVGNLDHLVDGIRLGRADAVLAASIFHYGEFTVDEAKERFAAHHVEVRAVTIAWLNKVNWSEDGLVPAVTQDAGSGRVLMVAWMNRSASRRLREPAKPCTGRARARSCGARVKNPGMCRR